MTESASAKNSDAHEALCRRCGISCHFAVPVNGLAVVVDELHCRFLVRDGTRFNCSVYEDRFDLAPWCANMDEALENGLVAQDCPYTAGVAGYRGKTRLHKRLLTPAEKAIRLELLANGVPIGVSPEGVLKFLARTGPGRFAMVENPAGTRMSIECLPEGPEA
jgi:uncharacterized cysteine cluster protein YcgN (CxxCxxCC family)